MKRWTRFVVCAMAIAVFGFTVAQQQVKAEETGVTTTTAIANDGLVQKTEPKSVDQAVIQKKVANRYDGTAVAAWTHKDQPCTADVNAGFLEAIIQGNFEQAGNGYVATRTRPQHGYDVYAKNDINQQWAAIQAIGV